MKTHRLAWLFILILLAGSCDKKETATTATTDGVAELMAKAESGDSAIANYIDIYTFGGRLGG
jgi:hypothetical protein